ncbi:MAG: hypothetical protein JW908_04520 [Anaerolineales bacterium]|nr:hypothetical protein [Anaerolineales bacterium]
MKRLSLQPKWGTLLSNLFFVWVILYFGMGGWDTALILLTNYGIIPWLILAIVCGLIFVKSNHRIDLPIFTAAVILGFWGEWWGTSRGFWTYWNNATPPLYLPPLWGIGVITVYHFKSLIFPWLEQHIPESIWKGASLLFIILPVWGFAHSWSALTGSDWPSRLDWHFAAGCLVGVVLIFFPVNWKETLLLYVCGTLIGGAYEYLGTSWGEWVYFTHEIPPWWIAPLWGYATVAMTKLPRFISRAIRKIFLPV